MRFRQKEFNESLKQEIHRKEMELTRYVESWLPRFQGLFLQEYKVLDAGVEKDGTDPFQPGYSSSLVVSICDDHGELIDLHNIPIWTCERLFLGLPVTQNLPGSRLVGDLLDEKLQDIQQELQAYIEDFIDL
ncbi:hypothetical protein QWY15_05555 [Planococcus sp. N064]|uniref:Uncharacterized protein n=1 Tax=Planococcus liqunii TaxID=3058394 RepID=A0ABT8MPD8_9BACL|nr:hypothetical protein [Planococcus sp. N064]MDN7226758.1 hypothetical protein [Planococcus sp. N064]